MSSNHGSDGRLAGWTRAVWTAFAIGLSIWVPAAALLGVPHGEGHTIETMVPIQIARDIAFPVWVGSLAVLLGAHTLMTLLRADNHNGPVGDA